MRYFFARFRWGLAQFPLRWRRLYAHLRGTAPRATDTRWSDALFLLFDLLGVFDGYELLLNPWGSRSLRLHEVARLRSIYGPGLPYELIRIDERARLGPPQYRLCYVSFLTINAWGPMIDRLLIHEAMHVWQYVHHGAAYIPRALAAQRTPAGYDYGGLEALIANPSLRHFNYEQQADIIADAFALGNYERPRWAPAATLLDLPVYAPFLAELSGPK